jgi:hypothetical protein
MSETREYDSSLSYSIYLTHTYLPEEGAMSNDASFMISSGYGDRQSIPIQI